MKNSQILIFTDLDGSLLNHNNFEFREIKRVSNSFNEINRPRYGQTLKSVIHSMSKIEILN